MTHTLGALRDPNMKCCHRKHNLDLGEAMNCVCASLQSKNVFAPGRNGLENERNVHFTFLDALRSKKGLFLTLKGSLVLSICPVFIFSNRGEMISFSIHNRRVLKLHWPTGCP